MITLSGVLFKAFLVRCDLPSSAKCHYEGLAPVLRMDPPRAEGREQALLLNAKGVSRPSRLVANAQAARR
jgi:hypothetical protein